MDEKFTPGPWSFDGEYVWADAIQGYVADPNTEDMQSGDSVPLRKAAKMIQANGRLIAAAPDLLHALKALLAETTGPEEVWAEGSAVEQARAAIAKATRE